MDPVRPLNSSVLSNDARLWCQHLYLGQFQGRKALCQVPLYAAPWRPQFCLGRSFETCWSRPRLPPQRPLVCWTGVQFEFRVHCADFSREAIEAGSYPKWDFGIQVIPESKENDFEFDILDATKVWPEEEIPIRYIGELELNRNPEEYFSEASISTYYLFQFMPLIFRARLSRWPFAQDTWYQVSDSLTTLFSKAATSRTVIRRYRD